MCGIAGIISRNRGTDHRKTVARMSEVIAHRGPDGEGFLVSDGRSAVPCSRDGTTKVNETLNYLPAHILSEVPISPLVLFAHRRLAIIDLTDAGHGPMCDNDAQ